MVERRNSMATNVMKNMSYKSIECSFVDNVSVSISFFNVLFTR